MDEEKTNKEPETTTTDKDEGSKLSAVEIIEQKNAAAERMEKANAETARLQDVQAERDQRIALGGQTEAGQPNLTSEEKEKEAAQKDANEIVDAFK